MKKNISLPVYLLLFSLTLGLPGCTDSRQKLLEKYVKEMNQECPMYPSIALRIDKFEAMPDLTVKITSTMPMLDLSGIEFDKDVIIKNTKKSIIRTLHENVYFNNIKKIKAKYIYSYYDVKQNHLYDIDVTPEEYTATLPPETDDEILQGLIEVAKLELKSLKRQLPIDNGNGIIISSCEILEDEKMYDYVFLLDEKTEKHVQSNMDSFGKQSLLNVKNALNNDPATKTYLRYGMSFRYTYKGHNGNTLCTFVINKDTP
jgi:hypothetical protein